jgi:hypothetical protein
MMYIESAFVLSRSFPAMLTNLIALSNFLSPLHLK